MTDAPPVTDTPIAKTGWPRPSVLDQIKGFVGDLARPWAIIAVSSTTAWAILDGGVDSGKLTAAGLILAALYGAKSIENGVQATATASVEKAKSAPTPVLALPASANVPMQPVPVGEGELRPEERVR